MSFQSFQGVITAIDDFWSGFGGNTGCTKLVTIRTRERQQVHFIVTPTTYFVNHVMINVGDTITAFYDINVPVPAIYPPRFTAVVIAKVTSHQNVKVDYFNNQLISSDGTLQLNVAPTTQILLENGQRFTANPANRNLIVIYSASTRSIPAQTVPEKIIVMC